MLKVFLVNDFKNEFYNKFFLLEILGMRMFRIFHKNPKNKGFLKNMF